MEGQKCEPFPPASQPAQPPGRSSTTTTTAATASTAPPAARLRPCFLGAKEGGGIELLGDNNCNRVRPGRLGCPPPQIPHVAILTQPRGTSRGRRRPVVVQSPFPSRNGGSLATRPYVELGVREKSHRERCHFAAWIWPCHAQLSLCLLLRCCISASRPRKNKGAWPSPSHSSSSSQSSPSLSPVPVPVASPSSRTSRGHHLDLARLAKAVNRLSYRGVLCPVPASLKPGFCPPKIPPFPPHRPASNPLLSCELCADTAEKTPYTLLSIQPSGEPRRVGDARRILPNPPLNYRRADQRHCQKRLLDSGTSPTVHKD